MDLPKDYVLEIVKPLYGIPESGLHWYLTYLAHHIEHLGMIRSTVDPCVLIKRNESGPSGLVLVQVDDSLTFGNDPFLAEEEAHSSKFQSKPRTFLDETPTTFNGLTLQCFNPVTTKVKVHEKVRISANTSITNTLSCTSQGPITTLKNDDSISNTDRFSFWTESVTTREEQTRPCDHQDLDHNNYHNQLSKNAHTPNGHDHPGVHNELPNPKADIMINCTKHKQFPAVYMNSAYFRREPALHPIQILGDNGEGSQVSGIEPKECIDHHHSLDNMGERSEFGGNFIVWDRERRQPSGDAIWRLNKRAQLDGRLNHFTRTKESAIDNGPANDKLYGPPRCRAMSLASIYIYIDVST